MYRDVQRVGCIFPVILCFRVECSKTIYIYIYEGRVGGRIYANSLCPERHSITATSAVVVVVVVVVVVAAAAAVVVVAVAVAVLLLLPLLLPAGGGGGLVRIGLAAVLLMLL